jgi:Flp pilus assembly pilin Flp
MFVKLYVRLQSARAELDEKALLIALFVIAAIVGLSPLGQAIAAKFQQLASTLGG